MPGNVTDPLGIVRGLAEFVTCVYGPAATYAFSRSLDYGVLTFCDTCELDQRSR